MLRSLARISALSALSSLASAQTTWFVDVAGTPPGTGTQADPFTSIQFAIESALVVDGDTVLVAPGTYAETIDFRGKALSVDGSGSASLPVIDAGGAGSAVTFEAGEGLDSELRGFEITGGSGTLIGGQVLGGGILILGAGPTLANLEIRGNQALFGGGIAVEDGSPNIEFSVLAENQSERGGGIHALNSAVSLVGGQFLENRVESFTIQGFGGAIYVGPGTSFSLQDTLFEGNTCFPDGGGGAIYTHSQSLSTDVLFCEFTGNGPGTFNNSLRGGAIFADGPTVSISSKFTQNGYFDTPTAGAAYGGSYVGCEFSQNGAQYGGAAAAIEAIACDFFENLACADGSGRGAAVTGSTLNACRLEGNYTCGNGGAASLSTLTDCVVVSNHAAGRLDGVPGKGGGLFQCTATRTHIEGNRSSGYNPILPSVGGGAASSDLFECTITSNWATIGGGTHASDTHKCSIVGNGAEQFGGVFGGSHDSTLVWHNLPATDGGGAVFQYSNLESGTGGATNLSIVPGVFGPTGSDVHLMAGSACIDAANPNGPNDADGSPGDIGALVFDPSWSFSSGTYCQPSNVIQFAVYCESTIEVVGAASFQNPAPVVLTASDVAPGQFGLLFHGRTSAFSPFSTGGLFGPGYLCVGAPIVREPVILSTGGADTCSGTLNQALSDNRLSALGYVPGDRLHAQFWYRQSPGITALTNAAELLVLP